MGRYISLFDRDGTYIGYTDINDDDPLYILNTLNNSPSWILAILLFGPVLIWLIVCVILPVTFLFWAGIIY